MARKKKSFKIKLVKKIKKGDVVDIRVQPKYPSTTGLGTIGDSDDFYRKEEAVFLKEMRVFFKGKEVSTFIMSSAISPNPRIEFPFKVMESGTLKVVFESTKGEKFTATKSIKI